MVPKTSTLLELESKRKTALPSIPEAPRTSIFLFMFDLYWKY
jgi:hypothetical protein